MRPRLGGKGMGPNKILLQACHFHSCEFFGSHNIADRHLLSLLSAVRANASAIAGDIRADPILAPRATSQYFAQMENRSRDIAPRRQNRASVVAAPPLDRLRNLSAQADVSYARVNLPCELNMDARPSSPHAAQSVPRPTPPAMPKKTQHPASDQIPRGNPTPSCREEYTAGRNSSNL